MPPYPCVPTNPDVFASEVSRAKLKSMILRIWSPSMSTLEGLMSRWTMETAWMSANPLAS